MPGLFKCLKMFDTTKIKMLDRTFDKREAGLYNDNCKMKMLLAALKISNEDWKRKDVQLS